MNKANELLQLFEKVKGTYVSVTYSDQDAKVIYDFYNDLNVPNLYAKSDYHTTLIYDVNTPFKTIQPKLSGQTISISNMKYEMFGPEKETLVVSFQSTVLKSRHEQLKKDENLKHSYPEFKSHITLSTDIGTFDTSKLPKFPLSKLKIKLEKSEPLND